MSSRQFSENVKPKHQVLNSKLVVTFTGHIVAVTHMTFSPNALMLATGCAKGWLNIWSLQVSSSMSSYYVDMIKAVVKCWTEQSV